MAGDVFHGPVAGQLGDHTTQYNSFHASRPRASWPHQVGVIPSRAECFQDRAEAARLRQVLSDGGTAAVAGGRARRELTGGVLAGLGGVGKTQLAADFARTSWSAGEVDVLVWLTAGTRGAAVDVYARAAVELLGADADDPERAAATFLAWLEPKSGARPCRWLVVLDDVADPSVLAGLWPPVSPLGRTLVTTRRRDAALTGPGRRRIEVGEFTSEEAADHLTAVLAAHERTEPRADVAALAADLGRLPLALSQAAAYLVDAGVSCASYRALLADRTRGLADLSPDVLPDGQTHTMAAAWSLSVDYADGLRPVGLARPMLQLAAFLDPHGIPATVLAGPPALGRLAAARSGDAPAPGPEDAAGALRALHRLSLVDAPDAPDAGPAGDRTGLVRVHRIVQRATRDTLTPDAYGDTARAAADALVSVWPEVERDAAHAQALRACTAALTACAEAALHHREAHGVLFRAGGSLGDSGRLGAAVAHFRHLAETTRHHLGADHPDTLTARGDLALWRGEAGDHAGAAAAFADLLADRLRVLGADHRDTLSTRLQLARRRGAAGDPVGAATSLLDLLHDMVRVLGPDHAHTLATRLSAANWLGDSGDSAGAATSIADVLDDMVRVLGPDDAYTLVARSDLAHWRGQAGDPAGAAAATADLLADRLRVLGRDHRATLVTRHNLAHWRGRAGDPAGAAAALADLLRDRLRLVDPDHYDIVMLRGDLAHWRGEAGDRAGAATALADLLGDVTRLLGPGHPETLAIRQNLARWRGESGDAAGAAAALPELLDDLLRVLGPDHPHTLATRHNLAHWLGEAGDPAGAAGVYADVLADRLRVLGPDEPDTLVTRHSLAHWQGRAGDPAAAATALAALLRDMLRVLGPDHPHTLVARSHLAYWRAQNGEGPGTPG
ncbi:Tetratricopeptide repeat-containing protein [Actinacidiphila rubida]|uniref:Tetratricopeptide repeat-containing protein n=2 Tax=Actinacidiphila rubida TaxID=310780 RepID=A0A1H8U7R6_9ACTN|nr:tetratricopeptide repeat protein [Actinacidiphila rubida]SEO98883.1 Tetratricopeptide repeat-containing protein [Actinacidiphila rubida]